MEENIKKIEGYLFTRGGTPISFIKLAKIIGSSEEDARKASIILQENMKDGGVIAVTTDTKIGFFACQEVISMLEEKRREDLSRPLSPAALETLSVILYSEKGVTKSDLDYIRGVNTKTIIRNLLIRGLVEKTDRSGDVWYLSTPDTYAFLGVSSAAGLPDAEEFRAELKDLVERRHEDREDFEETETETETETEDELQNLKITS